MTAVGLSAARTSQVRSSDGTVIAYHSVGRGPGLVVVGGVLSEAADYMGLAGALAHELTVHVMERRGRPGSGPQGQGHRLADECADLSAVAAATGSAAAFGHSFGGLVVLETARQQQTFQEVFVYEPGVPVRGQLPLGWLDEYQRRLEHGDRRGAFATMVKGAGSAPAPLAVMPIWYVRLVLRLAIRGRKWATMDSLLEANLVEHRLQAALDAPTLERFSTVTARTVLLGGGKSPDKVSGRFLAEMAAVIPAAEVEALPGMGHFASNQHPDRVAAAVLSHHRTYRPATAGPH